MAKITLQSFLICCLFIFSISCSDSNQPDLKLFPVKTGENWGYINKKGKYIINPQFKDAELFYNGLAKVVSIDDKIGYIDKNGKYIIPAEYKEGTHFSEGLAFVVLDDCFPICIDKSGKTKFELKQAEYVYAFSEGLALFIDNEEKSGFVNKKGKIVINPQFDDAFPFSEGLAAIEQNYKWGFINKSGKIIINPQFDVIFPFIDGKAMFRNDRSGWGYIDTKGNYSINPQFELALPFSEGKAAVQLNEDKEWGYINKKGRIIINPQFDQATIFTNGLSPIEQDNKWGYINKEGKIEINPQFDFAYLFIRNIAFVESSDKWGIINKKGKYIINPQFDEIKPFLGNAEIFDNIDNPNRVQSNYYDATVFINKFFEKASNNNYFDGFTKTSTLQNIINHPLYDDLKTDNKYIVYTHHKQNITSEISVRKTQFYFSNPVFKNVTTYNEYYGYKYETGTTRQYNYSEKFSTIKYEFSLSGNASYKGGAVAHALKAKIEKLYNVKMEVSDKQYTAYQEDNLSFIITYSNYSCSLYVAFNINDLQNLINEND